MSVYIRFSFYPELILDSLYMVELQVYSKTEV